ncbi:Uncharacterised protein [Mycobacteroides abscessus subsp. abscessus]|nr:Uncharacterised protein [Mycobacteroides abscessus subsp. abscessus]
MSVADSNSLYLGRTCAKWSRMLPNRALSSPVVYSVPSSISTSASVGLCPGPSDIDEMAVSTTSAPASMAFIRLTRVTPVVAWQWTLIWTSG